jgi:hypothetical protein
MSDKTSSVVDEDGNITVKAAVQLGQGEDYVTGNQNKYTPPQEFPVDMDVHIAPDPNKQYRKLGYALIDPDTNKAVSFVRWDVIKSHYCHAAIAPTAKEMADRYKVSFETLKVNMAKQRWREDRVSTQTVKAGGMAPNVVSRSRNMIPELMKKALQANDAVLLSVRRGLASMEVLPNGKWPAGRIKEYAKTVMELSIASRQANAGMRDIGISVKALGAEFLLGDGMMEGGKKGQPISVNVAIQNVMQNKKAVEKELKNLEATLEGADMEVEETETEETKQ